jgi:hypothetical protein
MATKIVHGAAVVVLVNGVPFAEVSGFQFSSGTPGREIRGIDTIETLELAPISAGCTGQLSLYRQLGDGGIEGKGLSTNYGDLPALKYITIQLIDRRADLILFSADRCRVESQTWSVQTKGLMTGQMSFRALSWSNETRQAGR